MFLTINYMQYIIDDIRFKITNIIIFYMVHLKVRCKVLVLNANNFKNSNSLN